MKGPDSPRLKLQNHPGRFQLRQAEDKTQEKAGTYLRAEDPQSHKPSSALAAVPPPSPQPRPGGRRTRVRSSPGHRSWDPPLPRCGCGKPRCPEPGRVPGAARCPRGRRVPAVPLPQPQLGPAAAPPALPRADGSRSSAPGAPTTTPGSPWGAHGEPTGSPRGAAGPARLGGEGEGSV